MAFIDTIEKVQTQALNTIADGQQRALEVNERVADAVKDRVPQPKLPFATALPSPAEGVKLYFDFAGKLLAKNRKFAEQWVGAWETTPAKAPTAPKVTVEAKVTVATKAPAKKTAAKRPAAKKTAAKKTAARKSAAKKTAARA